MAPVTSKISMARSSTAGSLEPERRTAASSSRKTFVLEGADRDEGALALGDVGAEVLVLGGLVAEEVEQVVLDLERQSGVHAEGSQPFDLLLGAAADDRAACEGRRAAVIGGLERCDGEVVVDGEVEAVVPDPAKVECLPLDGARGHGDELVQEADLEGVVKALVVEHRPRDEGEREVAAVDGDRPRPRSRACRARRDASGRCRRCRHG